MCIQEDDGEQKRHLKKRAAVSAEQKIICVDLDGTLIKNDLFVEMLVAFVFKNVTHIFKVLFWLFQGIAKAKFEISQHMPVSSSSMLFEPQLVEYLLKEKNNKSFICLATASPVAYADAVAKALPVFDIVIASDERINRKKTEKLNALKLAIGDKPFVYAGNSADDRHLWSEAFKGIYVNAPVQDVSKARNIGNVEFIINSKMSLWRALIVQR